MQVNGGFLLGVLNRQIEGLVKQLVADFRLPFVHEHQNEPRDEVAEVDGHPGVHLAHVGVTHLQCFATHAHGDEALVPPAFVAFQCKKVVQGVDPADQTRKNLPFPPLPDFHRPHRIAQPHIHIGLFEQDVSLDEQFLGEPFAQPIGEKFHPLAEDVVADTDRVEGDVGGNDQGRAPHGCHKVFHRFQPQPFGP